MNIPDKAFDAAQEFAYHRPGCEVTARDVEMIVKAAAPYIAAQALRDAADGYAQSYYDADITYGEVATDMREQADEMDPS